MRSLLFFFYLQSSIFIYCQDSILPNSFQLDIGSAILSRQDMLISPFIYSDFSVGNFRLQYNREVDYWQEASLTYRSFQTITGESFDYYNLDSAIRTAYPHFHTFVDLDYFLGKQIKEAGNVKWAVGGSLLNDIDASNLNYGRTGAFAYFASFNFGAWGAWHYKIDNNQKVQAKVTLPLVAWIARSPYLLNDDAYIANTYSHKGINTFFAFLADGNFATWNTLQSFRLNADYILQFSPGWDLGFNYDFYFLHYSKPLELTSFENNFLISVIYKF
ncbi:MAG: hypothetical protein ACK4IY_04420 [Chitinophagales bacterium]